MRMKLKILQVAFFALIFTFIVESISSVMQQPELVQVLFRNGERHPRADESYPRDPYTDYIGNQLTDLGRKRVNRLGVALHQHYSSLIGAPGCKEDFIYAYCARNDVSRSSLQELIRGLQCNVSHIQIHSKYPDSLMNSRICTRYRTELNRLRRNSSDVATKLAKYDGLYRYIEEKANISFDVVDEDERLSKLYRLLEAQLNMNLSLPEWCSMGVLELLYDITFLRYNIESGTKLLRRLNGAPLVRRFIESIQGISEVVPHKLLHLYSGGGHDVAAFARVMNRRYPRVPTYGSAIIVEKWRISNAGGSDNEPIVRIMIWTGASEKLFPIQLRGCPMMCPLKEFVKIVADSLPTDKDMRCLLEDYQRLMFNHVSVSE